MGPHFERFRGRRLPGVAVASFDGPTRAVRCAHAIVSAGAGELGTSMRAGVHAGGAPEVSVGLMGLAAPGEVLVSGSAKGLLAGSGFRFEDRGAYEPGGASAGLRVHALLALCAERPYTSALGSGPD